VIRGRPEAHGRTASSSIGNGGGRQETCLQNEASKSTRESDITSVCGRTRSRVRISTGAVTRQRQGGSGDREHEASRGIAVREQALRTGSIFEGWSAPWGTERSAGSPPSGVWKQAASTGNTVNPRIGSGLQQCPHRQAGGNRRGGGKPRGRNGTHAVAPRGRGRPVSTGRLEWTAETENRWRGPRGGDATEPSDEAPISVHSCPQGGASRLPARGASRLREGLGWSAGRSRSRRPRTRGGWPPDGGATPRKHGARLRAATCARYDL
jgi:hypothetical protein